MSTEIYYFSGTGNSLHVAKELQRRIPETNLIPIVSLLNQDVIATNGETVGFVFPIHLMSVPVPVKKFLEKLDLRSAEYIFAVSTLWGTPILADIHIERILKKKGKSLDSYFTLKMFANSPVCTMPVDISGMLGGWPPSREEISRRESDVQDKLDSIQRIIVSRERNPKDDSPRSLGLFLKRLMSLLMAPTEGSKERTVMHFYSDSSCTGCGICEKVCLSKRVKMINGKPVWQEGVPCYLCQACFAFCPAQSILVEKVYDKKDGRSFHPEITAGDIAGQKKSHSSSPDGEAAQPSLQPTPLRGLVSRHDLIM